MKCKLLFSCNASKTSLLYLRKHFHIKDILAQTKPKELWTHAVQSFAELFKLRMIGYPSISKNFSFYHQSLRRKLVRAIYSDLFSEAKIKKIILIIFYIFFTQNIDCEYTLEPPCLARRFKRVITNYVLEQKLEK